jgi:hypothetical protein
VSGYDAIFSGKPSNVLGDGPLSVESHIEYDLILIAEQTGTSGPPEECLKILRNGDDKSYGTL